MASIVRSILTIEPPDSNGEVRAVVSSTFRFTQREIDEAFKYALSVQILKNNPAAVIIVTPAGFDASHTASIPFDPNFLVGHVHNVITPDSTIYAYTSEVVFSDGNVVPPDAPLYAQVQIIPEVCWATAYTRSASVPINEEPFVKKTMR